MDKTGHRTGAVATVEGILNIGNVGHLLSLEIDQDKVRAAPKMVANHAINSVLVVCGNSDTHDLKPPFPIDRRAS